MTTDRDCDTTEHESAYAFVPDIDASPSTVPAAAQSDSAASYPYPAYAQLPSYQRHMYMYAMVADPLLILLLLQHRYPFVSPPMHMSASESSEGSLTAAAAGGIREGRDRWTHQRHMRRSQGKRRRQSGELEARMAEEEEREE